MARKKITQVTAKEIEGIINNSVQSAKNRLVGNAAEQKKMFVRPIANTDGSPSVAKLVQRLAAETEEAMQQLENNVEDLEDSLVAPPPADSIPLSGVFLTYDRDTETLEIVGEQGVDEEDVSEIVGTETNERFTELDNSITALSNSKQDKIEIADNYDGTTNKVATEATISKEVAKVIGGAGESFDTLKEIADWIIAHPNSVAEINAKIAENTAKINTHTRDIALNTSKADRNTSDIAAQAQRITSVQSSVNALSTFKQDKLSIADGYSSENPVATVRTVSDKIAEVVGGADASFDTLKEIADWINNNPESVAAINAKLSEHAQAIANNAEGITENALAIEENKKAIGKAEVKATQAANTANEAVRRIGVAEADIANLRDGKQNVLMFADEYSKENKVATERTVKREVAKIVADAPDDFNTLKEIAAWIAAHPNDISMLNALIQENSRGIALNASLIVNNTKAINENSKRINSAEIGLNDVNEYYSRLSKTVEDKADKDTVSKIMDTTVGKTEIPNQLYGTDADGNPALYPTDSVGTSVFVDGQKVKEFNADEKFDKIGGVIGGDVSIQGNLSVSGTTTTQDTETLQVKDNVIVANADGVSLVDNSGFAIKTNETESYGIMYDPIGDGVKIGLGGFTEDGKFVYNEGEAQFLATRADNITDGNLPKWDDKKKQFVDSGEKIGDYVKFTDYATLDGKAGIIQLNKNYGVFRANTTPTLEIAKAEESEIDRKTNKYKPVVPATLDYAVKVGVTTNTETLTDAEKASACEWLGAVKAVTTPDKTYELVYVLNKDGTQGTMRASTYETGNTIVRTDPNGRFCCNAPTHDTQAANKRYVDNLPDYLKLTDEQKTKWRNMLGVKETVVVDLDTLVTEQNIGLFMQLTEQFRSGQISIIARLGESSCGVLSSVFSPNDDDSDINWTIIASLADIKDDYTLGYTNLVLLCVHKINGVLKIGSRDFTISDFMRSEEVTPLIRNFPSLSYMTDEEKRAWREMLGVSTGVGQTFYTHDIATSMSGVRTKIVINCPRASQITNATLLGSIALEWSGCIRDSNGVPAYKIVSFSSQEQKLYYFNEQGEIASVQIGSITDTVMQMS